MANHTDDEQEYIDPEDTEYNSDSGEEQEETGEEDDLPEDTRRPASGQRLSLEEVNILRKHLDEWKSLKGDRRRPVTKHVRSLILRLDANKYIDAMRWNEKKAVRACHLMD